MEVALSTSQMFSEPLRRGTPLPLSPLVEETRNKANIPNHLDSKIYAKLKSNGLIQAEPAELHFSGFQLEKDYIKILKLINISSDLMNIHIIPTQTKHFQTSYTKKYRLIPGLAYTLKVRFCPDEWRYFYDCIRVHCQGEENLLIPVHAYPVIDDLHIPPHIDLPAVPLGQSVCHVIPLRCSCPIDFEFQVFVLQPHEAFSIHPLTGVIPANGEVEINVTFTPFQYGTSQVTIQMVVSQFNTKPFLCTITGSSAPCLAVSELDPAEYKRPPPTTQVPLRCKPKHRTTKETSLREQAGVHPGPKAPVDVCSPAGVAKMLIRDNNKLSSKDLKEALSCSSMVGLQSRQMKEALFLRKVQQNVNEQANPRRWQVHLGKDPMSEETRRHVAEEREIALHQDMVKRRDVRPDEEFAAGKPKLSFMRVVCEAGRACEGAPTFHSYPTFQWELRKRAHALFQQAARKVVIRCRMNRRLTCLKKPSPSAKNSPSAEKATEEATGELQISADKIFPFTFPAFCNEDDLLPSSNLMTLPVEPIDVTLTTHIPFFKLQVPQHFKLMGYQPVSAWEAFDSHVPSTLARPLRTGAPDELVPTEVTAQSASRAEPLSWEGEQRENEKVDLELKAAASFTFSAPEALLRPPPANPLRIFNPAPGLQAYKPTPKYMETDLEFNLCPLARYSTQEHSLGGAMATTPKFLDRKELIPGVMTWKNFNSITSDCLSKQPSLPRDRAVCRFVDYSADTLPLSAPPPLLGPPDDLPPLMEEPCDGPRLQLTPQMIKAVFLSGEALVSRGMTARHQRELQTEATYRSEINRMGKRVMSRLKQLGAAPGPSRAPSEDCE
ncbi:uncharacterized protein V6R79_010217 [Siganus canaliculatus]